MDEVNLDLNVKCPKEALSVLILCMSLFIFISTSTTLRVSKLWFIDLTVIILSMFNTLLRGYVNLFNEKTDKSAIFV